VRFCLAFPDVYEVGISHLGLKILYTILNYLPDVMADRTYLPWFDALDLMKQENIPLFALESKQAVSSFDVIGITLQSELTYTNILELLDLAGIPVRSELRTDKDPLILAGGPCASNPLPLSPFIDVFLIGEGEEAITEIAEIVKAWKNQTGSDPSRAELLQQLTALEGIYVPAVHDRTRQTDAKFRIKIRKYSEFHANKLTHKPQLLPWQLSTHNRYTAEIMRGCTRGCRFCHAGYFYRPVRERNPKDILDDLLKEVSENGWEEAGLISLSSSDYTCIRPLLEALLKKVNQQKTHVSLPSLRVDSLDDSLISLLREVGREGLTIAPEAGTQRLRDVINKNVSEADILSGIRIAKELGWQRIKLYFMLGLPTESEEDVQGIIDLVQTIIAETGKRFQISISLSPFVPKAHTPFQWSAMPDPELLLHRALLVKHSLQRYRFIKVRYHTIESSLLEAVLSRGDADTADWIESAWKAGACYDGWNEGFDWQRWLVAAQQTGYDFTSVFHEYPVDTVLSWDFIDIGLDKKWLLDEYNKALTGETTTDCRNGCHNCGVCNEETGMNLVGVDAEFEHMVVSTLSPQIKTDPGKTNLHIPGREFRLIYSKGGDFRFVGHLDWMRMVFRLFGKSSSPVIYTQGFNPHPKISFGPSLAVGVYGDNEYLDFHLAETGKESDWEKSLYVDFRDGLILKDIIPHDDSGDFPQPLCDDYRILFPVNQADMIRKQVNKFIELPGLEFHRRKKDSEKVYNLKEVIKSIAVRDNELNLTKLLQSPNICDLLSLVLELEKDELYKWEIRRTGFKS